MLGLGLAIVLTQSLILFSPLSKMLFSQLYGLSPQLTSFAVGPARLIVALPPILAWIVWQRAILIHGSKTMAVTRASILELTTTAITMAVLIRIAPFSGLICALLSMVTARFVAALSLLGPYKKVVAEKHFEC